MLRRTCPAMGSAAGAAKYAAMARKSSSRGSKRYIHNEFWEDRPGIVYKAQRGGDNIFKEIRPWRRLLWTLHDIRCYGLWEYWKKFYYLLELWRNKCSEKHLHGIDELGNKYWSAYESKGSGSGSKLGRFIEPKDPHWFRGMDSHAPPPMWEAWLRGMIAHTPQQIKARGEFGPHGRIKDAAPYKWQWEDWHIFQNNDDPSYVISHGLHISPWYNHVRETGFQNFHELGGNSHSKPFQQPHDYKMEVVESFYERSAGNRTNFRAIDSDDWGVHS